MKQEKLYCGIDVSNETIDVCIQLPNQEFQSETLPNSKIGFSKLIKLSGKHYHFVMEATGVYHLPLSFYLHTLHCDYSVVNAIKIKRYIQTCLTARQVHLERNKSDKKDAKYICRYGIDQHPEVYQMPNGLYFECKSLNNAIEHITRDITSYKNLLHSLEKLPIGNKLVIKSYKIMIEKLASTLVQLEAELYKKLNEWQPELVKLVSSVIGIGKRATSLLIVSTQGFKNTESYKQLISYAGLSPREYSSGTSINGRRRICKNGGGQLRHTLYMCALNAKKTNPACIALFNRLVEKGKNKKLAVVAVCNKLLKQVFAVVKNKTIYDRNYLQNCA